jgi:hypothetical protein
VAKRTRHRRAGRKPAVKLDKVKIDRARIDNVEVKTPKLDKVTVDEIDIARVAVDDVPVEKKCLKCSAERTERIRRQTAIIGLVAAILALTLFFGKEVVEARKALPPPALPIQQIIECLPVISVTVTAPEERNKR